DDALVQEARADAYEGLARALTWLDDDGAIEAYERAYRSYRAAHDDVGAARTAIWTAMSVHDFRGQIAIVRGWLARAQRLAADAPGGAIEYAMAIGLDGYMTLLRDSRPAAALPSIRAAKQIAEREAAVDAEIMLLALEGLALVTLGAVPDGMHMLD